MRNAMTGFAAVALLAGLAGAQTDRDLFAVNNLAGDANNNNSLISFNPTTLPNFNTIGQTGLAGLGAMDITGFSPATGSPLTMYAQDTFGGTGGVYEVNMNTGATTLVGTPSVQADDFAYNPTDGHMYGIDGNNLYRFDLDNNAQATLVGTYNIPSALPTGLGIASDGRIFIQDLVNDAIYVANPGDFNAQVLYNVPFNANFSQGIFVDWSVDNRGYWGALNNDSFDGELWEFDVNGGGLNFVSNFGPPAPDGLPPVEAGDVSAMPIPAPSTLALLGLGLVASRRRR